MTKPKVLALCGSTRKASSNLNLIHAIQKLSAATFDIEVFTDLELIPHFNPDLDNEDTPSVILKFRDKLRSADAILICTPEYAIGVPGTLKNAIDWTVSSMEFSQKPVALITASTAGERAHQSLLGTLLIIESKMTVQTQFIVSGIKAKISSQNEITDPLVLKQTEVLIRALYNLTQDKVAAENLLKAPSPLDGNSL